MPVGVADEEATHAAGLVIEWMHDLSPDADRCRVTCVHVVHLNDTWSFREAAGSAEVLPGGWQPFAVPDETHDLMEEILEHARRQDQAAVGDGGRLMEADREERAPNMLWQKDTTWQR